MDKYSQEQKQTSQWCQPSQLPPMKAWLINQSKGNATSVTRFGGNIIKNIILDASTQIDLLFSIMIFR